MPIENSGRYYPDPEKHGNASSQIASAAVTASGNGAWFPLEGARELLITSAVTAVSGTSPSYTHELELSNDGGTTSWSAGTMTAQTAANTGRKGFATPATHARHKWTVSGTTPSITRSITSEVRR